MASASLSRWARWLFWVVALLILGELTLPWVWSMRIAAPGLVARWSLVPSAAIAAAVCGYLLSRTLPIRLGHLRYFFAYPPMWTVPIAAFAASLAAQASLPWFVTSSMLGELPKYSETIVAVVGAAAWIVGSWPLITVRRNHGPEWVANELDRLTWQQLVAWASLEELASHDLMGHSDLVSRLSKMLRLASSRPKTTFLVGPFGSGKSSIQREIGSRLAGSSGSPIWFCSISCWGIGDSKELSAQLLRLIIETVDTHIDAAAMRGIPEEYLAALGSTQARWFSRLLGRVSEEHALINLDKLNAVLELADANVVVFVEDADRAAGGSFDPGHLERVLWRLKDLKRVSVLVAVGSGSNLDQERLADYVEYVPRINAETVRDVVARLYDHWTKDFSYVDARTGKEDRLGLTVQSGLSWLGLGSRGSSRIGGLATLVQTPRRLKKVIRRVDRVWVELAGEVDVDDLILVSVLAECARPVLDFLIDQGHLVRRGGGDSAERANRATRFKDAWSAVILQDPALATAEQIVADLGFTEINSSVLGRGRPVQGAKVLWPTDYLSRMASGRMDTTDCTDQSVLAAIMFWESRRDTVLVERLAAASDSQSRFCDVWEHFAARHSPEGFMRLAVGVLERLVNGPAPKWGFAETHSGMIALWRESGRRSQPGLVPVAEIARILTAAVPVNLPYALEIYYYWSSTRHQPMSAETRDELREAVFAASRGLTNGEALKRALNDSASGFVLRQLVLPSDQEDPTSAHTEPAEWAFLSAPLVGFLKEDGSPEELVNLIGDTGTGFERREALVRTVTYELRRDRTRAIFGEKPLSLLQLLESKTRGNLSPTIVASRPEIVRWLDELSADKGAST